MSSLFQYDLIFILGYFGYITICNLWKFALRYSQGCLVFLSSCVSVIFGTARDWEYQSIHGIILGAATLAGSDLRF